MSFIRKCFSFRLIWAISNIESIIRVNITKYSKFFPLRFFQIKVRNNSRYYFNGINKILNSGTKKIFSYFPENSAVYIYVANGNISAQK